jgi:hypothetical protein
MRHQIPGMAFAYAATHKQPAPEKSIEAPVGKTKPTNPNQPTQTQAYGSIQRILQCCRDHVG